MSESELAAYCHCSVQYLSLVFRGQRRCSAVLGELIAERLGLTVEDLFPGGPEP